MAEPHFIGWYHEHPIRIYKDDGESPWRVVFDPRPVVDAAGKASSEIQFPEARERTEDAAKHTAWALAQNDYLRDLLPIQDSIEWRKLRDD
jgi:hypothetical protein